MKISDSHKFALVIPEYNEALNDGEALAQGALAMLFDRCEMLRLNPVFALLALKALLAPRLAHARDPEVLQRSFVGGLDDLSPSMTKDVAKVLFDTIEAEYEKRAARQK